MISFTLDVTIGNADPRKDELLDALFDLHEKLSTLGIDFNLIERRTSHRETAHRESPALGSLGYPIPPATHELDLDTATERPITLAEAFDDSLIRDTPTFRRSHHDTEHPPGEAR